MQQTHLPIPCLFHRIVEIPPQIRNLFVRHAIHYAIGVVGALLHAPIFALDDLFARHVILLIEPVENPVVQVPAPVE